MRRHKRDRVQPYIVSQLRELPHVSVAVTSGVGRLVPGFPDLVIGFSDPRYGGLRRNLLVELKNPGQDDDLTEAERRFIETWKGEIVVASDLETILRTCGILPEYY